MSMPLARAARNIAGTFRYQLSLSGALAPRLWYALEFWSAYLYAKRLKAGADPDQATTQAMLELGRSGRSQKLVRVRLPQGASLEVDQLTCFFALKEIIDERIYELPDRDFSPREGGVVYDIGAQQGVYAVLASLKAGASGTVVAFEPEHGNLKLLGANLEKNSLAQARVLPLALSDKAGRAVLHQSGFNSGGHSLKDFGDPNDRGTIEVEVATLDAVAQEKKLPDPDLIKIDVEGSALAVLRGGLKLIARCQPRIVMELDALEDETAVVALLGPLGYETRRRDNNLFAWPAAGGRTLPGEK
jgi:FkbM family methyltransferase